MGMSLKVAQYRFRRRSHLESFIPHANDYTQSIYFGAVVTAAEIFPALVCVEVMALRNVGDKYVRLASQKRSKNSNFVFFLRYS